MQPLSLTLKGFRGIRAGLGLDTLMLDFERLADGVELIAIAELALRGLLPGTGVEFDADAPQSLVTVESEATAPA